MARKTLIVERRILGVGDQPDTIRLLGRLVLYPRGWRFFPADAIHKPSRKHHKTFEAALPRWTGGLNGTETRYANA
jgi:hypothetical protein